MVNRRSPIHRESAKVSTASRRGRPRAGETGRIEARILEAATVLFLAQGFERTTFDHVVEASKVSKTTLYAKFASKERLFTEVVHRLLACVLDDLGSIPDVGTSSERLCLVGAALARRVLADDVVGLMRMTAAEATRFPDLARQAYQIGTGGSSDFLAQVLGECDAGAASIAARRFVELAIHPLQMHALYGADLATLRARVDGDVAEVITLLRLRGLV